MTIDKRYLNAVAEVAAKKGRETLQYVNFTKDGHMQATDSYMLIDIDLQASFTRDFAFKLDKDLIGLLSYPEFKLEFAEDGRSLTIKTPSKTAIVGLFRGEYPNFTQIFKGVSEGSLEKITLSEFVIGKILKVSKALKAYCFTLQMPNAYMKAFKVNFHDERIRFLATPCREREE